KLRFVLAPTRNRVSRTAVPKQEFGNENFSLRLLVSLSFDFWRRFFSFPNSCLGTRDRETPFRTGPNAKQSFADSRSQTGVWQGDLPLAPRSPCHWIFWRRFRRRTGGWVLPAVLVGASPAAGGEGRYTVKQAPPPPPQEVKEPIRQLLHDQSVQLLDG